MPKPASLKLLQFKIIYRQSLLRVVDLEALSIQADVTAFLGQFAGVLIMLSLFFSVAAFGDPLHAEQLLVSTTMLVVGLVTILSWDATFPDRKDVMVLSPLPVAPYTILYAKLAASAVVLAIAVASLNALPGAAYALSFGTQHGAHGGVLRAFAAYWFTIAGLTCFLYCSVLTLQGLMALLLSRRAFLRLSAILQMAVFALVLGSYFLAPTIVTSAGMMAPVNHQMIGWSPRFWFCALCDQLNGSLPSSLIWLARRAWIAMGLSFVGAVTSLLFCYLKTMRRTAEQPDLVPGTRGRHRTLRLRSLLDSAIVLFCLRSLARSRQHRVALAFYVAIVCSIAFSTMRAAWGISAPHELPPNFLLSTFMMMSFAVVGLRSVVSLPISLNASWIFRLTQQYSLTCYTSATRRLFLLAAVLPVWIGTSVMALVLGLFHRSAVEHLAVLGLVGLILVELALIGFNKIPFACSYLPGKSNVQFVFWGFLILFLPLAMWSADYEYSALSDPFHFAGMAGLVGVTALGLWDFNRHHSQSGELQFEDSPADVVTTLNISSFR